MSTFLTPNDPITWHDQRPTHRAQTKAVTTAQFVDQIAWDAVDHISTAIADGESWSGLDTGEMYEAHLYMTKYAENASDALQAAKRAQWVAK